jgi:hypothetical protein
LHGRVPKCWDMQLYRREKNCCAVAGSDRLASKTGADAKKSACRKNYGLRSMR